MGSPNNLRNRVPASPARLGEGPREMGPSLASERLGKGPTAATVGDDAFAQTNIGMLRNAYEKETGQIVVHFERFRLLITRNQWEAMKKLVDGE